MLQGNAAKQIFLFTLPIMAGNFLQQLYNTVDGIVVGQFVSEAALAAIGTCAPVTLLYLALALGLSTGSGIVVAQYYGAGQKKDVRDAVSTSLVLLFAVGVVFAVIGALVAKPLLRYGLAVPDAELDMAVAYLRIYCIGLVFQFLYNIVAAVLRALGDSKATLYFLLISSIINIVLDLVLVIGFRAGIVGAAWATVIAQACSAFVSLLYMYRRYVDLRFRLSTWRFSREKCLMSLRMGIPTTLQQGVVSCGHMALQRLVNSFGVQFMAGYTAGTRLESYLVIPALAFMIGLSTFAGQNIGAHNIDRVREGYRKTLIMTLGSSIVLSAIALLFAKPLVMLFGVEGESLAMGIGYLMLVAPFFPIFALYQAAVGVLQGAGDVVFTMFCTLTSLGLRIVVAYVLAGYTPLGYRALCISMPIGWGYVLILSFWRYWRGKWKEKAVV